MRLVGTIRTESQAYGFHAFLLKQNIQNLYESFKDPETKEMAYHIWVIDEDDCDKAVAFLREFESAPLEARFQHVKEEKPPAPIITSATQAKHLLRRPFFLTNFLILICSLLFFLDLMQREKIFEKQGKSSLKCRSLPSNKIFFLIIRSI